MTEDLKFISDPMSVGGHILQLNASNNAVVRNYMWGLDLSGTFDGAGGVGGLLWVSMNSGPAAGTHFCAFDGNCNVVGLVSASTGTETARYEYGPFGEPIRVSGPAARANPFRFSTKRTDDITDLVLYEYRLFCPGVGRWPTRDPLGEPGFEVFRRLNPSEFDGRLNCYMFVGNSPLKSIDQLGLDVWVIRECSTISHRWVVGNNADGSYWSSDFMPNANSSLGRLCCRGTVRFTEKELVLIPTNLPSGFCIERHVPADQAATDEARKHASDMANGPESNQRWYVPGISDCRHWAREVADTAEKYQKNTNDRKPDAEKKTN